MESYFVNPLRLLSQLLILAAVSIILTAMVPIDFAVAAEVLNKVSDGKSTLNVSEIEQELLAAPAKVREAALSNKASLASLISPMFVDIRVEEAARKEGFEDRSDVKAAIERNVRSTIARLYLGEKIDAASAKLGKLEPLAYERYLANKNNYQMPESIKVAHILFKVDTDAGLEAEADVKLRAEKVLEQLRSGADFSKLAREDSDDKGTVEKGGELPGLIEKGSLVPTFEKAAYALKPNEVSGLVRTRFGFHIIKLLEHHDAHVRPYEEVKNQIIESIKGQLVNQIREDVVSKYRGTQDVEIPDSLYEELRNKFKVAGASAQ